MRDYEIINENLRTALSAFALVRPSGRVAELPAVNLVYAGVPYGLFNTALITAHLPGAAGGFHEQLEHAEDFFQKYNAPWSVWFCEDMLTAEERLKARISLAARGLRLTMEAPGMIAPALIAPTGRLPKLNITRVGNPLTRAHFSEVMSSAFQVPSDMSRDIYCADKLWTGGMAGWVGYLRGEPVSTVAVVPTPGVIGIYAVATQPRHQHKGYAETVMRHAIDYTTMATGDSRTVLQSSAAGYSLYVRMGYRQTTRFFVYIK